MHTDGNCFLTTWEDVCQSNERVTVYGVGLLMSAARWCNKETFVFGCSGVAVP
jgi:hypothetical protein